MPFEIVGDNGNWKAVHAQGRCGGPRSISIGDTVLLSQAACRVDGIGDDMLHSKGAHVFHKAGAAIFESEGTFSNGVKLFQSSRYIGQTVRTTVDLYWPKGILPKKPVEVGSFIAPGKWNRLFVLTRDNIQDNSAHWQAIQPGDAFSWDVHPLALVLANAEGMKLECSLGFDLWRWDYGLGFPVKQACVLKITEDGVTLQRCICPPLREQQITETRFYRFVYQFAWNTAEQENMEIPANVQELIYDTNKKGIRLPENPSEAYLLNLHKLPVIANAGKLLPNGERQGFCLEDGYSLTTVKRIVRQLAEFATSGTMVVTGLEPGICLDGNHVEKKIQKLHWDISGWLAFIAWASHALGEGWTWAFIWPENCWMKQLPSFAALHHQGECHRMEG